MKNLKLLNLILFIICSANHLVAQPEIILNEIMASNITWLADEHGEYDDWFEIFNQGDKPVNLSGYCVTDNLDDSIFYQIPSGTIIRPNRYLVFWADGQPEQGRLHTNFQLSSNGERIFLLLPDGETIVDSFNFPELQGDISYGRVGKKYKYFIEPSPGKKNKSGYEGVADPPLLASNNGTTKVRIKHKNRKAEIRYTLDCSEPTLNASVYKSTIQTDSNMLIRAKTFIPGFIPSESIGKHLVFKKHKLPVVSIITNPQNLWGKEGIYDNYRRKGMNWERKITFQLTEGLNEISLPAGIRIQGNSSRIKKKKSFRIFFRPGYSNEKMKYELFEKNGTNSFRNLVLRAGYDDDLLTRGGTLLKDPFVNALWKKMGYLSSDGKFSVLYINNQYWGIYEIRESVNEHFFASHLKDDNIDIIRFCKPNVGTEKGYSLKYGKIDDWEQLLEFFKSNDFQDNSVFEEAGKLIDIKSFTDLMILVNATGYRSWYYGIFAYKIDTTNSKWQWTIWDMDRALDNVLFNEFEKYKDLKNNPHHLIISKILQNPGYRDYFIERTDFLFNTVLKYENVIPILDSLKREIEPEIEPEIMRWSADYDTWIDNIENVKAYLIKRPEVVRRQMSNYFYIAQSVNVVIDSNIGSGEIQLNSIPVKEFPWEGEFFSKREIKLEAIPERGYRFSKWSNGETSPEITVLLKTDTKLTAFFEKE